MNRTKIKICGLMRREDILCCAENGVDIAGFVVEYPVNVPWNLAETQASALLPHVKAPMKSCIVTGGSTEKIMGLAERLRPDFVQLHYHENLADTRYLATALLPFGIRIIKTLPLNPAERLNQFNTADVRECIQKLNESGVYAILIDSRGPSGDSGMLPSSKSEPLFLSGLSSPGELFLEAKQAASVPLILAGGITSDNVTELCRKLQPDIIDVMTGTEIMPGIKDTEKIKNIVAFRS